MDDFISIGTFAGGIKMKTKSLFAVLVFLAMIVFVGQSHAVTVGNFDDIDTIVGPIGLDTSTGTIEYNNISASFTLTGLSPVDIVVPMFFSGVGPEYSVTLAITNATSLPWTGFHLETGWGTGCSYETSSGQDQPLFLSKIASDRFTSHSLIMGDGEGGTPAHGIFDVGINWDAGIVPVVPIGDTVNLSFSFSADDTNYDPNAPPTQWNTDSFPLRDSNGIIIGFMLTVHIFPTTQTTTSWTIDKWAGQSDLTLPIGQLFTVNYSVQVDMTSMGLTDNCVLVSDSYDGVIGMSCSGPCTFTRSRTIGPYDTCGTYIVENTASFITEDTGTTGSDSWTVTVNVPCPPEPPTVPSVNVSPSKLGFDTVTAGDFLTHEIKIENVGTADLTVSNIALCSGTSTEYSWSPSALPLVVHPGSNVPLSVTYAPADQGTDTGCLKITSNDPNNPVVNLSLTGTGTLPTFSLDRSALDFGEVPVGFSGVKKVKIHNLISPYSLTINSIDRCTGTSPEFTSSVIYLPYTFNMLNKDLDLSVMYSPTDQGTDTGCLKITSNNPGNSIVYLSLTGTGRAALPPTISLDPSALDFGKIPVDDSTEIAVQVQNLGDASLTINSINRCTGTSPEFNWVTQKTPPFAIQRGFKTDIRVVYTPTGMGSDTGCLSISSNDPVNPVVTLNLTAAGGTPDVPVPDLDIVEFKATKKVVFPPFFKSKPVDFSLVIENVGEVFGPGRATLVGNKYVGSYVEEVYTESIDVSVPLGEKATYSFPTYNAAAENATIFWTVTIDDGNPDTDAANDTTQTTLVTFFF